MPQRTDRSIPENVPHLPTKGRSVPKLAGEMKEEKLGAGDPSDYCKDNDGDYGKAMKAPKNDHKGP